MADNRKDSIGEEASAFGERVNGAAKDAAGAVTGNERLEREGERENAIGDARQESNDMFPSARDAASGVAAGTTSAAAGTARSRTLSGLFRDRESAESAYRSLTERGYTGDDVNVVMSDETRKTHFADDDSELGSKALEGMGVGGAVGGTVGALLAAIAAIGTSLVLPGIGLVVAGPLAAALAGAGAGGATGGLLGALVGSGIPEERAQAYQSGIGSGGIVIGVAPRSAADADYLAGEWQNCGGADIHR